MKSLSKKHIPLCFLVLMGIFWAWYYQSVSVLNDFGQAKPEIYLLIDGLIVLPLLCFFCIDDKKQALFKSLAYSAIVVLLGSMVIPENGKLLWHWFESGRYLILAAFLVFEVVTIATVFIGIKAALNRAQDPEEAISRPVEKRLGKGGVAAIIIFEARVWTYALFAHRVDKTRFTGDKHFYGDAKDGTQSNLLGFVLIIAMELPLMHLLLHFIWSPLAANIVSALTLISLVFFIAEYRAIVIRPVSLNTDSLLIRYGVWPSRTVNLENIAKVEPNKTFIRRAKGVTRYNLSGVPNVAITLMSGERIYLGLNNPQIFIRTMRDRLQNLH